MGSLVIVESAAKAGTIQKYLNGLPDLARHGPFVVMASMGHVRKIPDSPAPAPGTLHGIRLEGWMPLFETEESKLATVAKLKAASAKAKTTWLATDPDREGEGIAWHLAKLLKLGPEAPRVRYNEITQTALREAFGRPGRVDQRMVKAQMSRQMLDRIYGYQVSPLVIDVVGANSSAGRVQSAALRLAVERVEELERTDWTATSVVLHGAFSSLDAACRTPFPTKDALFATVDALLQSRPVDGVVKRADAKSESEQPPPPFSTSALQQAAHRALRVSPKETMRLAQQLFEAGHITYMRTDSTTLSEVAIAALLERVRATYGDAMAHRREHRTRAANAQEAHEAIRPTVPRDAAEVGIDDGAQARLYDLIYRRTLATQMAPATYDALEYAIDAGGHAWEGKARRLASPGWKALYSGGGGGDEDAGAGAGAKVLPAVAVGATVRMEALTGGERLPTARSPYCEAALVKAMEDAGVGRPSTYASTLEKLQQRQFVAIGPLDGPQVTLEGVAWKAPAERASRKRMAQLAYAFKDVLVPTAKGRRVLTFLKERFTNLVDLAFTSSMETALDRISEGASDHKAVMSEFFRSLEPQVAAARAANPGGGGGGGAAFEGGWTVIENQYGPALRSPRSDEDGKSRFVSLNHYLAAAKKSVEQLTQADVDFMASLPRSVGGHKVADSRNGFYVTGPVFKGDLPDALVAQGAAITLSSIEAALASKLRSFQIGSATWVAREGPKGPYLQGPPADDGKPHYVDLKYFLEWKRKPLSALTHEDVRKLATLPRAIGGGMTLGVGMYGFYAKDAEGKYKNLNDDLSERIDTVTLIDVQGTAPRPRRDAGAGSGSGSGASASSRGDRESATKSKPKPKAKATAKAKAGGDNFDNFDD